MPSAKKPLLPVTEIENPYGLPSPVSAPAESPEARAPKPFALLVPVAVAMQMQTKPGPATGATALPVQPSPGTASLLFTTACRESIGCGAGMGSVIPVSPVGMAAASPKMAHAPRIVSPLLRGESAERPAGPVAPVARVAAARP